ncbi:Uncharacterised protein [Mycobacteroides abscessus subsp. abscessus]|nr:Uncharacterised protein [Mycobacteroides abscessus subsp. abscessus]SKV77482.1 Uncharacterised protein [Mycobacteroides abscessus subsp. abscessus]
MPEMGNPLAIPLAITRTSGVTPKCWCPKYCPVRPNPVCTSSRTKRMPCSRARSAIPVRNSVLAGM